MKKQLTFNLDTGLTLYYQILLVTLKMCKLGEGAFRPNNPGKYDARQICQVPRAIINIILEKDVRCQSATIYQETTNVEWDGTSIKSCYTIPET